MRNAFFTILILTASISSAQENPIVAFDNLVGDSWISEGLQLGGFEGKTVHEITWGLNEKIVKVKTFTTDPETRIVVLRNEGIRAFNSSSNKLEFYEFDKLGGISVGIIKIDGKNIHFEYSYEGLALRDSWIYKSKNEYLFIVGIWGNGEWDKKFYETSFKRVEKP